MEKMIFYWEKGEEKGHFMVNSSTIESCMEIANEEIEKFGAEMIDWHSI
jgi:hypothetical protein